MIYAIMIIFSVISGCLVPYAEKKKKKSKSTIYMKNIKRNGMISISLLFPLLVSSLRYGLGTDYSYTYIPQFNSIARGDRGYYEIGFYLLNKIVSFFTNDGQWIIVICSILFVGIVYRQIYRESKVYALSILLLYLTFAYFVSLNNVRQSLASAFLLLAMECLCEGRKLAFIVWVLLSASMHQVSLIFLLLFFADRIMLSAVTYLIVSIVAFGVMQIIGGRIVQLFARYIPRLQLYFQAQELSAYTGNTIGRYYILMQFLILILFVYIEKKNNKVFQSITGKDQIEWNITLMSQCALLCVCALDGIVPAAYRVVRIFSFAQFILIPNAIRKYVNNKKERMLLYIASIILFGVLFIFYVLNGAEQVFPYRSIFRKY